VFAESEDLDLWLRISDRQQLASLLEIVVKYRLSADPASVRGIELQVLSGMAARAAARDRALGRPDLWIPRTVSMNRPILALGATREEVSAEFVKWALGKKFHWMGDVKTSEELFDQAEARAKSASGSAALVAEVFRRTADQNREERRFVRARVELLRAALTRAYRLSDRRVARQS
jgi:hypothetical protein